jgi:hypothetical protein
MSGMALNLRCPTCGNGLVLEAQSRPRGTKHKAVLRCPTAPGKNCGLRWVIHMEMFVASMSNEGEANRCGTRLGYIDHERNGTEPCDDCETARHHARTDRAQRTRPIRQAKADA